MSYTTIPLVALLTISLSSRAQTQQSSGGGFQVNRSQTTATSPTLRKPLDLDSIPVGAKQRLLPLYKQEYALIKELDGTKWQALFDVLSGLASTAGGSITSNAAAKSVQESAARAGQYGARYHGVEPATDPLETSPSGPAEMHPSVNRGMELLIQIDVLEKQISRVQNAFGIDPTARTPWSALFPGPMWLTPDEVTKLLLSGGRNAAKPLNSATMDHVPSDKYKRCVADSEASFRKYFPPDYCQKLCTPGTWNYSPSGGCPICQKGADIAGCAKYLE